MQDRRCTGNPVAAGRGRALAATPSRAQLLRFSPSVPAPLRPLPPPLAGRRRAAVRALQLDSPSSEQRRAVQCRPPAPPAPAAAKLAGRRQN